MASICPAGKHSWPELVGENGEEAARIIESENSLVYAIIVDKNSPGTLDFKCNRVRVVVDENGVVVVTPCVG